MQLVCSLQFQSSTSGYPPSSRCKGHTGYSIVLPCKSSLCYGQVRFVCVFRCFSCRLCFLGQLFFTDWKAPDYNQLCRGTPGSFVDYECCIISSPLAKLLIEGVMSRAAPARLAVADAHASTPARGSVCCSHSCFSHVRLCGFCAVAACSAHSDSGFPPSTAAVDLGRYMEFRCPGNGLLGGVCTPVS